MLLFNVFLKQAATTSEIIARRQNSKASSAMPNQSLLDTIEHISKTNYKTNMLRIEIYHAFSQKMFVIRTSWDYGLHVLLLVLSEHSFGVL